MGGQRYRRGLLMPGEGAVNPAMLGVMMRHLAKGELDQNGELSERNGNVVVNFAEFLSVENICPRDGVISCHSKDENKKIVLKGERIIMAGISPKIVAGIDLEGADRRLQTNAYRTVIAVTKPLNGKLPNHFNAAVHDTTFHYNYVWADPETSRLMWGTGDFSMYPTMTKKEMLAFVRDQMAQTMKHVPEIEYVWPGDIPYTRDGLPGIYQKGKVAGWVAPGANGLAASVALSTIVCKASLGDEHAMQLAQNLMKRQTGFDPSKQAEHTPDYMKSAPFKVQDGWAQQDL